MAGKTLEQNLATLEAKPDKTPEDLTKIEELKQKVADKAKAKAPKEGDNDFQDYQKFGELKFIQWKEDKFERKCLKPKTLVQFEKLEEKFRNYSGKIPKVNKTVFLGIGIQKVRIVKGFGVPESLYKMFVDADTIKVDKYFE